MSQKQRKTNADTIYQLSALVSRAMMADRLGVQFEGKRDLYDTFGYLKKPEFRHYLALYERQGMATSIVDSFPGETWRKPPILIDGKSRSDDQSNLTPFLKAWNALEKRLGVFRAMRNVDTLCGVGRYALLFLGVAGESFAQPVPGGAVNLAYLSTFDEGTADVAALDKSKTSERYGLPTSYRVQMSDSGARDTVHYSRVIHVAEGKVRSRVYGRPRLQTVINRLFDIEKVIGGASEAVWLSVYKGYAFMAREGFDLPQPGTPAYEKLEEDIDEYVHGLRRYMRLNGVDVKDMGSEVADPSGIYYVLVSDIAGSIRTPKRILIGSEAGELASTQDDENWASVIQDRQRNFAEPEILRPFIDWCVLHEILPAPQSGEYLVEWPSLFQLNDVQRAEIAVKVADAINKAGGGVPESVMPPEVFAERYLGYVSENPTYDSPDDNPDDSPDDTDTQDDQNVDQTA